MQKIWKQVLCTLLVLCLIVSGIPAQATPTEDQPTTTPEPTFEQKTFSSNDDNAAIQDSLIILPFDEIPADTRSGIVLNYTSRSLYVGGTFTLTATVSSPVWTSSDSTVASVSSAGVVTAKKVGTAVITVTSPSSSHSASCTVYVCIADGVYHIKSVYSSYYAEVQSASIQGNANVQLNSMYDTDNLIGHNELRPLWLCQKWKIKYLGSGKYSIRPMHKLNMGLHVTSQEVDTYSIGTTDALSSVNTYAQWTIEWRSMGYVIKQGGSESNTLRLKTASTATGVELSVGTYSGSNPMYHWDMEAAGYITPDILLYEYDTSTGTEISYQTKYVAPGESKTLASLSITPAVYATTTINQNVIWESLNPSIATVNTSTGTVTGVSPGAATIQARTEINGTVMTATYYAKVTEIPNGTYFIGNKATGKYVDIKNQSMVNGTQIHQWELHGGNSQRWAFTHLGDGYYSIKSVNSTGSYYLGVSGDSTANDTSIVLRTGSISNGMRWKISVASSGAYIITPKTGEANNRVLAVGTYLVSTDGVDIQQRDYVEDTNYKDEWSIIRMLPTSGAELSYNPSLWSDDVENNNNCYAYAINNQTYNNGQIWYKQQPGGYAGITLTTADFYYPASNIISAVESDFEDYSADCGENYVFLSVDQYEVCPAGTYKVALVVAPGTDYHWYRQDSDGLWSHKPGTTPVLRTDNSGKLIIDPQIADRGRYTVFIGYFAVSPWNNYYASGTTAANTVRTTYGSENTVPLIDENGIEQISIGMSLDEVTEILGSKGLDIGYGAILFQYSLKNGDTVILNYALGNSGELVLCNIIREEA